MLLADTSVWIDHLRGRDAGLAGALDRMEVFMHPFVLGELACGNLKNRRELLSLWSLLPVAPTTTHAEAMVFIERHRLMGSGLGYIDVHLLAATALAGASKLWTKDRRLAQAATRLRLGFVDPM